MRALFVIHFISRPERSRELEEVDDHLGEMVRRRRTVPAAPQHKFEIGQWRQGLGGPKRFEGVWQVVSGKIVIAMPASSAARIPAVPAL
jgi:hypothetical protein